MTEWKKIEIGNKLYLNVHETVLTTAQAAIENAFINAAEGQSRFPGMDELAALTGNAPVYLDDWQGDLVALTSGQLYTVDRNGVVRNRTGVPIPGAYRPVFAKTPNELLIAAGGEIIRLAGTKTEILSADAPLATHVAYIGGYVVAAETDSGFFYHSEAQEYRQWDPIDIFAANSKPDPINALIATRFEELIVGGPDSTEQYERLPSGNIPFFRRWSVGNGVFAPYTLIEADNAVWAVNHRLEFARISGQTTQTYSEDVQQALEDIDDWTGAWAHELFIAGHRFILLQAPHATNIYGTPGVTMLYDYQRKHWHSLYGWNDAMGVPGRWPGWSVHHIWGRTFAGCDGKICELKKGTYANDGVLQRMLGRTAHLTGKGEYRVDNVRMMLRRGVSGASPAPTISLRCKRDNRVWTPWKSKSLGRPGDTDFEIRFGGYGWGHSFQFEWMASADVDVELKGMEWMTSPGGDR